MAAVAPTILVVEDESSIASFVSLYLRNAGYTVRTAATGAEALSEAGAHSPALIVLDLMLPDIDGIEVCRRLRQSSDVPILMLTARDEDVDKIIGLEVGADDYLTKPFNPRELVARIKSVLRRSAPERRDLQTEVITHGDLRVDAGRREATVNGEEIQLAPEGVRPAVGAARPPRARPDARPAARARLGLHLRRRHADGRRPRAAAAAQARRRLADRDRVGRRLQGVDGPRAQRRRRHLAPSCGHAGGVLVSSRPAAAALPRGDRALERRHDADRDPALPQLRPQPDPPRPPSRVGGRSRSSTRAPSRRTSPPSAATRAGRRRSPGAELENATGDKIYFDGPVSPFPGENPGLPRLNLQKIDWTSARTLTFSPRRRARRRLLRASRTRSTVGHATIGAIVVAKQKTAINQFADSLVRRLAIAFAVGLLVAVAFAWYVSRRLVRPLLRLSHAADEVAVGRVRRRRAAARAGRDRPPRRAVRGDGPAADGVRGARAELPDVGLARAAHAADGDPRPRSRARGGARRRTRGSRPLARDRRSGGGAARAARRRHPRPRQAERAPLHGAARGGRDGAGRRARVRDVRGAGPVAVDRLLGAGERAAGDRLRRRPRAPDRRQPALERVPRHAGRRPHRARARTGERHGARGRRGQRARASRRPTGSASSGRSCRVRAGRGSG